jgi:hypothetical protein
VCRLFFLADYRNVWRKHVCCPYGCRVIWRRERSNTRVAAYYDTETGRKKKRALNRRRSLRGGRAEPETPPPPPADEEVAPEVVTHLQFVVGLFEGRRVGRDEIIALLAKILRQHKMGRRRWRGYGAPQTRRKSRGG